MPVPLRLVEARSAFSALVKISFVADFVAHVAVTGQAYQGLRVDIRIWLPVRSPPLLSSFPPRLQLWAPLPRREPACRIRRCWPSRSASCSCAGTRVPEQEGCCRPTALLVPCFSRAVSLCVKLLCTRGLRLQANPAHPVLRTLLGAFGQEGGREDAKGLARSFRRWLTAGAVRTRQDLPPPWVRRCARVVPPSPCVRARSCAR